MRKQRGIQQQDIVSLIPGGTYVGELVFGIGGIQIDQFIVFVFLVGRYQFFVFLETKVFAVGIFKQGKFQGPS
jgi:hypothetical protein